MPSHPHESDPTGEPACRELAAGQELAAVGPAHPDDEDTPTTGGTWLEQVHGAQRRQVEPPVLEEFGDERRLAALHPDQSHVPSRARHLLQSVRSHQDASTIRTSATTALSLSTACPVDLYTW